MRYVRAMALLAVLGSLALTAGCGGQNGGMTPPTSGSDQSQSVSYPTQSTSDDIPATVPDTSQSDTSQTDTSQSVALAPDATVGVPAHVLTATVVYGYGGTPTSVPLSSMKPYLSWDFDPSGTYASTLKSNGIKVAVYANFWRNYSGDNPNVGYQDLKPGGKHAAAEAKTCSGAVIKDLTYKGGYEADARSSAALGHAQVYSNYRLGEYSGHYDAMFTDDTNAMSGIPLPCGYANSAYVTAINKINTALKVPIFFSAFGATADPVSDIPLLTPTNVIGGMCEICYAGYNKSKIDYVHTGARWQQFETAELQTVAKRKIYWVYARAIGDPSKETAIRKYIYASFLLTYDPTYTMLQVAFKTTHGFPIMPETGLVPMKPVTTSSAVTGYLRSGGAYMREFGACYYRGVAHGKCAVVINPGTSTVRVPTTAYAHSMVLAGSGVLEGGSVTFTGGRVSSLAPANGAILFQ